MDITLEMIPHITTMARTANIHLRNISWICQYLFKGATESIIHYLVSSWLDHGNGLLAGQPVCHLHSLQMASNTAVTLENCDTHTERSTHYFRAQISQLAPCACKNEYKLCLPASKTLHGAIPAYFSSMVDPCSQRKPDSWYIPRTKSLYGMKAFSVTIQCVAIQCRPVMNVFTTHCIHAVITLLE